jgi:purine-binding chemotaxis protein CheW
MTLHVVFAVAGVEYATPIASVLQMESFTGATPVPGAPAYVLGVVTLRGRVIPVIDLRRRFGLSPAEPTLDTRIIVTQVAGRVVAFCVDRAREVLTLDLAQLQPAPTLVSERAVGLVNGVFTVGSRLLLTLDLPRISENDHDHEPHALLSDEDHHRPALPG